MLSARQLQLIGAVCLRVTFPRLRRLYFLRYVLRLCVLAFVLVMYFLRPRSFGVLSGWNFLYSFSWLHVLWVIWAMDTVRKLIPQKGLMPLGSLKHFKSFYKPSKVRKGGEQLGRFLRKSGLDSLKVLIVWALLLAVVAVLWHLGLLEVKELLVCAVVLYVLDLTCVLFWCPFRELILKNRCCQTCRIFNWDHLMIFSPLLFVPGFFSISLICIAFVVFSVWEISFILHPERFSAETNAALRCDNCTDQLCGREYCET